MKTYGIELEVSNLSISDAQRRLNDSGLTWAAKSDGTYLVSAEAVSPILTDERLNETKQAARALLAGGATVNKQTGYHVHIGADHYGADGIAALVHNWNFAHATIGALVAPSRLNNHFCRPVELAALDSWIERVRNGNISNAESGRYYSLNLNSYQRHGTVEIRLHHGTLNGSKIKAWAQFVAAMADFSQYSTLTDAKFTDSANRLNNLAELLTLLPLEQATRDYLNQRAAELAAR